MTRIAFIYNGKKGTLIASQVLHKAPKDAYCKDIIKLIINSKYDKFAKVMTRKEAVIIANALLFAYVLSEGKK